MNAAVLLGPYCDSLLLASSMSSPLSSRNSKRCCGWHLSGSTYELCRIVRNGNHCQSSSLRAVIGENVKSIEFISTDRISSRNGWKTKEEASADVLIQFLEINCRATVCLSAQVMCYTFYISLHVDNNFAFYLFKWNTYKRVRMHTHTHIHTHAGSPEPDEKRQTNTNNTNNAKLAIIINM